MKKNIKGFSMIMALGLVIFINLIAISIIDYIIPFSKDTKGIENSIVSYYQANSGIENALFYLKEENYEAGRESSTGLTSDFISSAFNITARGNILPPSGQGNSEYDLDWNQIAMGNPIQLEIGNNKVKFNSTLFAFRIPNLKDGQALTLSGGTDYFPIINWQISSQNNTLNATGSYIYKDKICKSTIDCNLGTDTINFNTKPGIDLNGDEKTIGNFYTSNCGVGSGCILKLSIINKLETVTNNISIPYLEWQINFGTSTDVPLRYSIIETEGKAYGYKKSLKVRIPQQTTNEAFDFTVFQ